MAEGLSIVILCKPLAEAKQRLAPVLEPHERAGLAVAMLRDLLAACLASVKCYDVAVQSADPAVGAVARAAGAQWHEESGAACLDAAASTALASAREARLSALMLLPSDLPLARTHDIDRLVDLGATAGVRARDGGTNALLLDPARPFNFAYGPNSFSAHSAAAKEQGRSMQCLVSGGLVDDIDTPNAFARLFAQPAGPSTSSFLSRLHRLKERIA